MIRHKVIRPVPFDAPGFQRAVKEFMEEVGETLDKDFGQTYATWDHKPEFKTKVKVAATQASTEVATEDEIYGYVSAGTKPHPIEPVRAKVLAFPSVFKPKTKPGRLKAGAGASGGAIVLAKHVDHPGTEAREFDKLIEKKREKWFREEADKMLKKAAKASRHGL